MILGESDRTSGKIGVIAPWGKIDASASTIQKGDDEVIPLQHIAESEALPSNFIFPKNLETNLIVVLVASYIYSISLKHSQQ